jgi:hypothetical protein
MLQELSGRNNDISFLSYASFDTLNVSFEVLTTVQEITIYTPIVKLATASVV